MVRRILLADNDIDFLNTRTEFLERAGYDILKARSLSEAEWLLQNVHIHIAIIDIRMQNDDDEYDKSGLILAQHPAYRSISKIILTDFPMVETAVPALKEQSVVDYVVKEKGHEVLLESVKNAFIERVRINWDIVIEWKAREPFGLTNLIYPGLEGERLLNRAEELEDLFRRLFYEKDHIRIDRLLWQRDSRVALVVYAFKEGIRPEFYVVICGQNKVIHEEAHRFNEYAPLSIGDTGTMLGEKMRAETTHFGANAYSFTGNDLENIQTLTELYRFGTDKIFNTALNTLYQTTLKAWHQERPVITHDKAPDTLYRERLHLAYDHPQQYFEERTVALESTLPMIRTKIEHSGDTLVIHFNGQTYTYLDPLPLLINNFTQKQSVLMIYAPGTLTGDNILADDSSRTWLTDFAEAGLVPLLWNFIALEAAIRFDWVETDDLQRRHELERCLVYTGFSRPDTRDLEPSIRKPARAIQTIRKLASRWVGDDFDAYHIGIFFHAARRLADFNPSYPLTSNELSRLGHIYLSAAMIAARLTNNQEMQISPDQNGGEISIKDKTSHMVLIGNNSVHLPPQPFSIFLYLYENSGRVCTTQELFDNVLGGKYDENYLHTLIGRIRKLIEADPDQPRYVITERNVGFRLFTNPK